MNAPPAKLKIAFGKPLHNWLPVEFVMGDFHLEFQASGVLSDPLADLVSSLLLVTQGVDAAVDWWLEPAAFSFQFSIQPQGIQLEIIAIDDLHSVRPLSRRQLFCVAASYEAIIVPFWRALQKLTPADFNEANWHPLPLEKQKKLTSLLKARRQTS